MDGFERLLKRKTLDSITVSDVAREAGVDRKTFYMHFGSIDGLLNAIAEEDVSLIATRAEQLLASFPSQDAQDVQAVAIAFARVLTTGVFEALVDNSHYFKALPIEEILRRARTPLEREVHERNLFGLNLSPDVVNYCITFALGGVLSVYQLWAHEGLTCDVQELSRIVEALVAGSASGAASLEIKTI